MSLTDKKVRALCKDLRDQIHETPSATAPIGYQRMLAGLQELLQHRVIAREILKFERDPMAKSFESIIRMVHQVHDKKISRTAKTQDARRSRKALSDVGHSFLEAMRNEFGSTSTQVEERRRG